MRLELLGVGAMRSPRFAPAGLLVSAEGRRIAIDGGAKVPVASLDAWLLTDEHAELAPEIRRRAAALHVVAAVRRYACPGLDIRPRRVVHTPAPLLRRVRARRRPLCRSRERADGGLSDLARLTMGRCRIDEWSAA